MAATTATAARTTAAAGAAADTATSGVATTVAASDAAVDGGLHRHHRAIRHQRCGNETHIAHEQTHFEDAGVGPVSEGHARVAPDADDVADVPNVDASRRPRVHDTKRGEFAVPQIQSDLLLIPSTSSQVALHRLPNVVPYYL